MTVVPGTPLPVGLRHVQIFELDENGYPLVESSLVYEGVHLVGGKTYTLNIPDARVITHTGDDRTLGQDTLPSLETMTCELRAARNDFDVYAILSGTKVVTDGEAKMIGIGTNQLGFEPQLGMMLFQQSLDDTGARTWRSHIFPKARVLAKPMGMNENPAEHVFQVLPYSVTHHLWQLAFAEATEGFVRAQVIEMENRYVPWIVAWEADGTLVDFDFHTDRPAILSTKVNEVFVNGVITAFTVQTGEIGITFTIAPSDGDKIVCSYEIENPPD